MDFEKTLRRLRTRRSESGISLHPRICHNEVLQSFQMNMAGKMASTRCRLREHASYTVEPHLNAASTRFVVFDNPATFNLGRLADWGQRLFPTFAHPSATLCRQMKEPLPNKIYGVEMLARESRPPRITVSLIDIAVHSFLQKLR